MLIPELRAHRIDETHEFAYRERAYRLRSPGQLSIASSLPDGRPFGISWSYSGEAAAIHVRLGGSAPFGRDGEYLGLFTRTEDLPPILREPVEGAIAAAAWYIDSRGAKA